MHLILCGHGVGRFVQMGGHGSMGGKSFAIAVEAARALLAGGLFMYLLVSCRRGRLHGLPGANAVVVGAGLLFFAMALDVTECFPAWRRFVVFGVTGTEFALEKLVGYLPGMGFLLLGFWRMIPAVQGVQEAQERERLALDSSGVGVLVTDPRGEVVRMNQVAEALTGWSLPEGAGRPVEEVFAWTPEGEAPVNPVRQVLAGGTRARPVRPGTLVSRSGCRYRVADSVAVLPARNGAMAGVVLVFRDVTTECVSREALLAREEQCRHLEETVACLRMENSQQHAQKMDAMGRLAGGIAHDLNNQLGGIMGAAELLDLELTDPEPRLYLGQMQQAASRASELTQQLLAFARRGIVRAANVDVHALIVEVVTALERGMDQRIVVTRRLLAKPHHVSGDAALLQKMLLGLGRNARDAMPEGGELLFATDVEEIPDGQAELKPGRYLRISVSDTGMGLSDEARSRFFEPFFPIRPNGKGAGLVLAAVYGTVKSHQGDVRVESKPGHGTVLQLYLPVIEAVAAVDVVRSPDVAVFGRGRVLLVDDEVIIRGVGEQLLQSLGYEVVTAADGEAAVAYYQQHWRQVDLILLDMIMPKLGGRETFRALKAINPGLRVILASGYSMDNEAQSVLDEGALGFIQKPLRRVELSQRLAAALPRQELHA